MKYKPVAFFIGDMNIVAKKMFIQSLIDMVGTGDSVDTFTKYDTQSICINYTSGFGTRMKTNNLAYSTNPNSFEVFDKKNIPVIYVMDALNDMKV